MTPVILCLWLAAEATHKPGGDDDVTEADYLVVTALTRVRAARDHLRDILPGEATGIPLESYQRVNRALTTWESNLNARISIEEE